MRQRHDIETLAISHAKAAAASPSPSPLWGGVRGGGVRRPEWGTFHMQSPCRERGEDSPLPPPLMPSPQRSFRLAAARRPSARPALAAAREALATAQGETRAQSTRAEAAERERDEAKRHGQEATARADAMERRQQTLQSTAEQAAQHRRKQQGGSLIGHWRAENPWARAAAIVRSSPSAAAGPSIPAPWAPRRRAGRRRAGGSRPGRSPG